MPSLATPAAVCAASLRLRVDVRGDRGVRAVAAGSISRSRAARAVLASSSSERDLRARLRRRRAAGWRRGGWELASIACRALSTSNEEEEEEEEEEEQSRGE